MAERLRPGVYVEEVSSGIQPITGVGTSTAAFIGTTPRGVPGQALFIDGLAGFAELFGGHVPGEAGLMAQAIQGFFANGGRRAYAVRVLPADAVVGTGASQAARQGGFNALTAAPRGAGRWSTHLRVHINEGRNFPLEAFSVEVQWAESGQVRTLERFEDVRMDPEHEDYFARVINETSSYIEITDAFQEAVDALGAGDPPLIPATAPTATSDRGGPYQVARGARVLSQWRDADGVRGEGLITFDNDALALEGLTFDAGGRADLTAAQLARVMNRALGPDLTAEVDGAGFPAISVPLNGTAARVRLDPADGANTFDLAEMTGLRIAGTLNAAPVGPLNVNLAGLATPGATPATDLVGPVNLALAGSGDATLAASTAEAIGGALVISGPAANEISTLSATLTHGFAALDTRVTAATTAGAAGTLATAATLTLSPDAGTTFDLSAGGAELTITAAVGGAPPANLGLVTVAGAGFGDNGAVTAAELAAALTAAIGAGATVNAQGNTVVIQATDQAGLELALTLSDPAIPVSSAAVAGVAGTATRARLQLTAVGGGNFNLSDVDLMVVYTRDGVTTRWRINRSAVAGPLDNVTAARLVNVLNHADNLGGSDLTARAQGDTVRVSGPLLETAGTTLALISAADQRLVSTTTDGAAALVVDDLDGLSLTLSEVLTPGVPPVLRGLGLPARARGFSANNPAHPAARPGETEAAPLRFLNGDDGSLDVTTADFVGDAVASTGLRALDGVEINLLCMPGRTGVGDLAAGMAWCDNRGDCFFIADGPGSDQRDEAVRPQDARLFVDGLPSRSDNVAMFYPWIEVADPTGRGRNPTRLVPPSGHLAGIFARTDIAQGVWVSPAGIEAAVRGAVGFQHGITDAEQELLNPVGLNALRQRPRAGIVTWGTRTLSSNAEWRYIAVRRMMLFLKSSIREGLQWAVFKPNAEALWDRIRRNINAFMLALYKQGAFQGADPGEAFEVLCDRSTNPQALVDQGIVTAEVRFAPLKPAEFVVVRISQKTLLSE